MTQNEQIAKIMGWKLIRRKGGAGDIKFLRGLSWNEWVDDTGKFLCFEEKLKFEDTPSGNWITKKLQAKMVADGWNIEFHNWMEKFPDFPAKIYFEINAINHNTQTIIATARDSEPAALHDLFCKVFSIR